MTYIDDAPVQVLFQVWHDDVRRTRQPNLRRETCKAAIQVNEAFVDNVALPAAVFAVSRSTVGKHVVPPNHLLAGVPFCRVLRNISQENKNSETSPKLKLPYANADAPVIPLGHRRVALEYTVLRFRQESVDDLLRSLLHRFAVVTIDV